MPASISAGFKENNMLFDTHAHYDDERFDEDRDALLASMPENNVGLILNPGCDAETSRKAVGYANRYPFVYAAVGLHPENIEDGWTQTLDEIRTLAQSEPRVRAIGEIGLDYYWDNEPHEVQQKWFIRQLELAGEVKKPVIIHSREAAADTMYIMKNYAQGLGGVIHCYSYSREMAEEYVKMGFYIGIGGVVTFKNAKKLKDVAAAIPIEKIVLETDCPYMAPEPYRGKRNQSSYIQYVAEKIAELKEMSPEEVIAVTEKNARDLYGI